MKRAERLLSLAQADPAVMLRGRARSRSARDAIPLRRYCAACRVPCRHRSIRPARRALDDHAADRERLSLAGATDGEHADHRGAHIAIRHIRRVPPRIVSCKAVLFSAAQAASMPALSMTHGPVVLFDLEDETGASIPHGIGIAPDGQFVLLGGLRLRPTRAYLSGDRGGLDPRSRGRGRGISRDLHRRALDAQARGGVRSPDNDVRARSSVPAAAASGDAGSVARVVKHFCTNRSGYRGGSFFIWGSHANRNYRARDAWGRARAGIRARSARARDRLDHARVGARNCAVAAGK